MRDVEGASRRLWGFFGWFRRGARTELDQSAWKARTGSLSVVLPYSDLLFHGRERRWVRWGYRRCICLPSHGKLRCVHPGTQYVRRRAWPLAGRLMEGMVGGQSALSCADVHPDLL